MPSAYDDILRDGQAPPSAYDDLLTPAAPASATKRAPGGHYDDIFQVGP